jgi:hypothetical protein
MSSLYCRVQRVVKWLGAPSVGAGGAARRAGNGRVLAQRGNAANDRFTTRPKGATQMPQYSVSALEKDMPFPADCVLSWTIWVALNPTI